MERLGYSTKMKEIQIKIWDLETLMEELEENRNSLNRKIIDLKEKIKRRRRMSKESSVDYIDGMMELQVELWNLKDDYKNVCRMINEKIVKIDLMKKDVMRERDVMIGLR